MPNTSLTASSRAVYVCFPGQSGHGVAHVTGEPTLASSHFIRVLPYPVAAISHPRVCPQPDFKGDIVRGGINYKFN